MNKSNINKIYSEVIVNKGKDKSKKIWFLVVLFGVTLTLSFIVLLAIVKLQGYLTTPLQEYAIYAYIGAFFISLLSSSTVIFPAPGMALVLAAASKWNPAWIALAASIGGSLGEIGAYYVGRAGKSVLISEQSELYKRAERWMHRYGGWIVTFIAMVPISPFDVVGLVAGALRFPVGKFLFHCWLGRLPRTFVEVYFGATLLRLIFPSLF